MTNPGARLHECAVAGALVAAIVLTSGCIGLPHAQPSLTATPTATLTRASAATPPLPSTPLPVLTAATQPTAAATARTANATPTRPAASTARTASATRTRTAASSARTASATPSRAVATPVRTTSATSRPPATSNNPPTADNITTSARTGSGVAITLKGHDIDGDNLTYTIVRQPRQGSLAGTPPFVTYAGGTGVTGTDSFTYRVNDGKADSPIATVEIRIEALRWVRVGAAVLNNDNVPLAYHGGGTTPGYFTEPRFAGKFTVYRLSATGIGMDDRDVDRGVEFYNVTIQSSFDAPPAVLIPGDVHTLTVTFSHSGVVKEGSPGATFQYSADRNHSSIIAPREPLAYAPWSQGFAGVNRKAWRLTVPQATFGTTMQISAGWWNCSACNVTWSYRSE